MHACLVFWDIPVAHSWKMVQLLGVDVNLFFMVLKVTLIFWLLLGKIAMKYIIVLILWSILMF